MNILDGLIYKDAAPLALGKGEAGGGVGAGLLICDAVERGPTFLEKLKLSGE